MVVLAGARQTGKISTFRLLLPNLHWCLEISTIDILHMFA